MIRRDLIFCIAGILPDRKIRLLHEPSPTTSSPCESSLPSSRLWTRTRSSWSRRLCGAAPLRRQLLDPMPRSAKPSLTSPIRTLSQSGLLSRWPASKSPSRVSSITPWEQIDLMAESDLIRSLWWSGRAVSWPWARVCRAVECSGQLRIASDIS